jgi:hypothetical protein
MSKYTEAHENAIREMAPMNLDKAKQLAETPLFVEAGITHKGIVSKCRNLGVEYEAKERVSKTGKPVMRKETIVSDIEAALSLAEGSLASLEKSGKQHLEILAERIGEIV